MSGSSSNDIGPTYGTVVAMTYTNLITSEYNQSTDFVATVAVTVQPLVDLQNVLLSMPSKYDVDNAVGVQLDAVGLWVGITRNVDIPLQNVYFSLDTPGLGLDQGYLQGPFDPIDGVSTLNDTIYRLVIYAKIAANNWDGTITGAASALRGIFNSIETPGALLFILDNQNMSMTYGISGILPGAIYLSLLASGYISLVPGGISVNYVQASVNGYPCFGLDVNNEYIAGLDVGVWAQPIIA